MWYVYIIRSVEFPDQFYVGLTENLNEGLAKHNGGEVPHSAKFKPWGLGPPSTSATEKPRRL